MMTRKKLSANGLLKQVMRSFRKVQEHRVGEIKITLADTLMAGFALFALKDPSLLAFDERRGEAKNLHTVFGIEQIPCDTQMRTILDEVEPERLRPVFKEMFRTLQRGKALEAYQIMGSITYCRWMGRGISPRNRSTVSIAW